MHRSVPCTTGNRKINKPFSLRFCRVYKDLSFKSINSICEIKLKEQPVTEEGTLLHKFKVKVHPTAGINYFALEKAKHPDN